LARRHGRNGQIYIALTSNGTATPLNFQAKWSINFSTDKVYVAGLPDASGDFSGFYDDATVQSYTAATDGVARPFYLYPDRVNTPGQYFFGTIFPDFKLDGDVGGALKVSASWVAASTIAKVG
jgi:hypothetical protein